MVIIPRAQFDKLFEFLLRNNPQQTHTLIEPTSIHIFPGGTEIKKQGEAKPTILRPGKIVITVVDHNHGDPDRIVSSMVTIEDLVEGYLENKLRLKGYNDTQINNFKDIAEGRSS